MGKQGRCQRKKVKMLNQKGTLGRSWIKQGKGRKIWEIRAFAMESVGDCTNRRKNSGDAIERGGSIESSGEVIKR